MKNKDWKQVIEKNEKEVIEALSEIYEKACTESPNPFKLTYYAIIDADGGISHGYDTGNSTDGKVWNGEAIYIGAKKQFIPWEHDDEWGYGLNHF